MKKRALLIATWFAALLIVSLVSILAFDATIDMQAIEEAIYRPVAEMRLIDLVFVATIILIVAMPRAK